MRMGGRIMNSKKQYDLPPHIDLSHPGYWRNFSGEYKYDIGVAELQIRALIRKTNRLVWAIRLIASALIMEVIARLIFG